MENCFAKCGKEDGAMRDTALFIGLLLVFCAVVSLGCPEASGCGERSKKPYTIDKNCEVCSGTGRVSGTCSVCQGGGSRKGIKCEGCNGTGSSSINCTVCGGGGRVLDDKEQGAGGMEKGAEKGAG